MHKKKRRALWAGSLPIDAVLSKKATNLVVLVQMDAVFDPLPTRPLLRVSAPIDVHATFVADHGEREATC